MERVGITYTQIIDKKRKDKVRNQSKLTKLLTDDGLSLGVVFPAQNGAHSPLVAEHSTTVSPSDNRSVYLERTNSIPALISTGLNPHPQA